MEEIIVPLVYVKYVLQLIEHEVILGRLIEIFLEAPKHLPDHCARRHIVEVGSDKDFLLLLSVFIIDLVLIEHSLTDRWMITFMS